MLAQETLQRRLVELKTKLLGDDPSLLERLLVDRLGVTWLQVHAADLELARSLKNGPHAIPSPSVVRTRLDSAHRRYLYAIKQLAFVRKLLPKAGLLSKPGEQSDREPPSGPPAILAAPLPAATTDQPN